MKRKSILSLILALALCAALPLRAGAVKANGARPTTLPEHLTDGTVYTNALSSFTVSAPRELGLITLDESYLPSTALIVLDEEEEFGFVCFQIPIGAARAYGLYSMEELYYMLCYSLDLSSSGLDYYDASAVSLDGFLGGKRFTSPIDSYVFDMDGWVDLVCLESRLCYYCYVGYFPNTLTAAKKEMAMSIPLTFVERELPDLTEEELDDLLFFLW